MASVYGNYTFNECDTLLKFCNLLSNASVSRFGNRHILLQNGEKVVIEVARKKFELLKGLSELSDESVKRTHILLDSLQAQIEAEKLKYTQFAAIALNLTFDELIKNFQIQILSVK